MNHTLKNKELEIHIDFPLKNYNLPRFDWTGKIVSVKYKDVYVSGTEKKDCAPNEPCGRGFYNEFGINSPVGYDEAKQGDWFHKIGIGLLKKDDSTYLFHKPYAIRPAEFEVLTTSSKIKISCVSESYNGYSYTLKKEIALHESSFTIHYSLQNTGAKTIEIDEYNHNFIAINNSLIGSDYILKFPFRIQPNLFGETVNTEKKVEIGENEISFNGSPKEQFFFSNLSGSKSTPAEWELLHLKNKIGIKETGSFETSQINLWGWEHVISPELFFTVSAKPGQSIEWQRSYLFHSW